MSHEIKNLSAMNIGHFQTSIVWGEVEYSAGGTFGPRTQFDYQFIALLSGELELTRNDKSIRMERAHALILTPRHREHFRFSLTQTSRHIWCSISSNLIPPHLKKTFKELKSPVPLSLRMQKIWELGFQTEKLYGNDRELLAKESLMLGITLMCDVAQAQGNNIYTDKRADEIFEKVESYVAKNYGKSIQLGHLAKAAGISTQHLLKLFRDANRPTPTTILYDFRLNRGVEMLTHTGLSVSEIAYKCGFQDPFHFSRRFRLKYALSPLQFRKRFWRKK